MLGIFKKTTVIKKGGKHGTTGTSFMKTFRDFSLCGLAGPGPFLTLELIKI